MAREVLISKEACGQVANNQQLVQFIEGLPAGKWLIKAQRKDGRTLPQNAFYWEVIVPHVKKGLRDLGHDEVKSDDDAHEVIKRLFLKKEGTTTKLSTVEFSQLFDSVIKWGAEYLNIQIPYPNEEMK